MEKSKLYSISLYLFSIFDDRNNINYIFFSSISQEKNKKLKKKLLGSVITNSAKIGKVSYSAMFCLLGTAPILDFLKESLFQPTLRSLH